MPDLYAPGTLFRQLVDEARKAEQDARFLGAMRSGPVTVAPKLREAAAKLNAAADAALYPQHKEP